MMLRYVWTTRPAFGEHGCRLNVADSRRILARLFCANTEENKPLTFKQRKEQIGEQFLANLSPEMELKKKQLDNRWQELRLTGLFDNVELTAWDYKHILSECPTDSLLRKYLQYRRKTALTIMNKKEKKRSEKRTEFDEITPETFKVYQYTIPHYYQELRHTKYRDAMTGRGYTIPVVIDLDYSVSLREQRLAKEHIGYLVYENRNFTEPCSLYITSYRKNEIVAQHVDMGEYENCFIKYEEKGFETLFPREKLVYLSPYGPQLKRHTPGDIYVIGGMVDLGPNKKYSSYNKAKDLNIRCGSIPFSRHGLAPGDLRACRAYTLTTVDVFRIVLQLNLVHDWTHVMNALKRNSDLVRRRNNFKY